MPGQFQRRGVALVPGWEDRRIASSLRFLPVFFLKGLGPFLVAHFFVWMGTLAGCAPMVPVIAPLIVPAVVGLMWLWMNAGILVVEAFSSVSRNPNRSLAAFVVSRVLWSRLSLLEIWPYVALSLPEIRPALKTTALAVAFALFYWLWIRLCVRILAGILDWGRRHEVEIARRRDALFAVLAILAMPARVAPKETTLAVAFFLFMYGWVHLWAWALAGFFKWGRRREVETDDVKATPAAESTGATPPPPSIPGAGWAFGGCSCCQTTSRDDPPAGTEQKGWRARRMAFDSTLGYPGEGPVGGASPQLTDNAKIILPLLVAAVRRTNVDGSTVAGASVKLEDFKGNFDNQTANRALKSLFDAKIVTRVSRGMYALTAKGVKYCQRVYYSKSPVKTPPSKRSKTKEESPSPDDDALMLVPEEDEVKELQDRISELEDELEEKNNKISDLQQSLATKETERRNMQLKFNNVETKLKTAEDKIFGLEASQRKLTTTVHSWDRNVKMNVEHKFDNDDTTSFSGDEPTGIDEDDNTNGNNTGDGPDEDNGGLDEDHDEQATGGGYSPDARRRLARNVVCRIWAYREHGGKDGTRQADRVDRVAKVKKISKTVGGDVELTLEIDVVGEKEHVLTKNVRAPWWGTVDRASGKISEEAVKDIYVFCERELPTSPCKKDYRRRWIARKQYVSHATHFLFGKKLDLWKKFRDKYPQHEIKYSTFKKHLPWWAVPKSSTNLIKLFLNNSPLGGGCGRASRRRACAVAART